ncbi:MAG: glutamate--cysteine ligase [Alphaproteobacteria bacterium]|jgi:glutamate--cysteine ligase|nr:glutamate--cysteine ligase [Alphaproteobacteria bacterium]MBT5390428.1 glutamate--cysteine ligase [Alphaproteobacteria bacterium]MBT5540727.1 glutamate--cysteine ligase [Alphaproteobacteria bacterium]MBT5654394.1 glutamate--cysteine ligase [Alphaproteobacteria bacterium]
MPPKQPVTSQQDLIRFFESGCKKPEDFLIGTEHEVFMFEVSDFHRLSHGEPGGIQDILISLQEYGWTPIKENGSVIALKENGASITLEPGGQFELSGAPLKSVHDTHEELCRHQAQLCQTGEQYNYFPLGIGLDPVHTFKEIPWMPKERYRLMRAYMPTKGNLGLDMMTRTATIQTNLDFSSEQDMVKKFRVGLALQPIATALFSNSPILEGVPNDYQSYRAHIWQDTDPDRCGFLNFVFEEGMGFERYVDYLLDVPMYFVHRNGQYLDATGKSFRNFLTGNLEGLEGQLPSMDDWNDHTTTVFPEVRLKQFLEMRGADANANPLVPALSAFWTGLLYDQQVLDEAYDLIKTWTQEERLSLYQNVPKTGLRTKFRKETVRELGKKCLTLAQKGLEKRDIRNKAGHNETIYLAPLIEIVESGKTPADVLLEKYKTVWDKDVKNMLLEVAKRQTAHPECVSPNFARDQKEG